MHLQGEGNASAAAEELVAEEAKEAAKAAAKKAKKQKQKAKARKQQTLSDATPTSEAACETRLQCQLDVEAIATAVQGSPSQSRSLGSSPDQGVQPQLQHVTGQAPALLTAEDSAVDEQASATAAASAPGACNAAAAANGSCEADVKFLDRLFCCPISEVPLLIHRAPAIVSEHPLVCLDTCAPFISRWHR